SAAFEFLITEFPKLLVKLGSVLQTLLGSLLSGFGQALTNMGDKIPVVGGAIKGLGIIMMGLGEAFKDLGRLTDWAFNKIKDFDLTRTMSAQWDGFKYSMAEAAEFMLNKVPGPILAL